MSNKDLLNLCRLNLMEENIEDSPAYDRDMTLKVIDFAKRQLAIKIGPGKEVPGVEEQHKTFQQECEKINQEIMDEIIQSSDEERICP